MFRRFVKELSYLWVDFSHVPANFDLDSHSSDDTQ